LSISVNISPKDFYYLDVYKAFVGLVERYRIDPGRLNLEITESAFMSEPSNQIGIVKKLRQYGFSVEMDDFGSGYSSLNMLKDMEVDVLKIDMGFLRGSEDPERTRMIILSIIEMAHKLRIPVLAEGVETAEQLEFLTKAGCDLFQGYYFGKPISVERFEERFGAEIQDW
jgi:EAL domain-containing protein (putative c-di-GMP-specific phosphodiesterase class I)